MDTTCMTEEFALGQALISPEDLDAESCIYVNMDNCLECYRQAGEPCNRENMYIADPTKWNCNDPNTSAADKVGCTGVGGYEFNISWLVGMAPPPPGMRLWPTDNAVYVYWDNSSEVTPDIRINRIDFESYRIWRADNWDRPYGSSVANGPESGLWQMIAEYDVINNYINTRDCPATSRSSTRCRWAPTRACRGFGTGRAFWTTRASRAWTPPCRSSSTATPPGCTRSGRRSTTRWASSCLRWLRWSPGRPTARPWIRSSW